jgi:hypothetical protein
MHMYKYPRTAHLAGSGIQRGDEDVPIRSWRELANRHLVIEEKMDGANSAVSFDETGRLLLQSRGHFLNGGPREAQFNLFKTWAHTYMSQLFDVLEDRYIMYGEWLYAKHTVFYTDLPHYFLEFDIYDKQQDEFLNTERRRKLLAHTPCVVSVKVLYEGLVQTPQELTSLIEPSHFISEDHLAQLREACQERHLDASKVLKETDQSQLMEGLYVKIEEDDVVKERYKYVRSGFLQAVFDSESHWQDRPILPNQLKQGVSLF